MKKQLLILTLMLTLFAGLVVAAPTYTQTSTPTITDDASILEDNTITFNIRDFGTVSGLQTNKLIAVDSFNSSIISSTTLTGGTGNISDTNISVTFVESLSSATTATLNLNLSNTAGDSTLVPFQIQYNAVDDNPVPNANLLHRTMNEDTTSTVALLSYIVDPEGDSFTVNTILNDANLQCSIDQQTNMLTFTPVADFFGNATCQIQITQGANVYTHDVLVTVNNVADSPSFVNTYFPDVLLTEGVPEVLLLSSVIADPDGYDDLSITFTNLPTNVNATVDATAGTVTFQTTSSIIVDQTVRAQVTVSDTTASTNLHSDFDFSVIDVNMAPVIGTLPYAGFTLPEDLTREITGTFTVTDEDVQGLTFSVVSETGIDCSVDSFVTMIASSTQGRATFRFTPVADFSGAASCTIQAVDSQGLKSATVTMQGTITNSGDAPEIPTAYMPENASLVAVDALAQNIDLIWNATDVDNDALTFDVYFTTKEEDIDKSSSLLANDITTTQTAALVEDAKTYFWKVVATDGTDTVSSETFTFDVVKDLPVRIDQQTPLGGTAVTLGLYDTQDFTVTGSDPEEKDVLTFWKLNGGFVAAAHTYTFDAQRYAVGQEFTLNATVAEVDAVTVGDVTLVQNMNNAKQNIDELSYTVEQMRANLAGIPLGSYAYDRSAALLQEKEALLATYENTLDTVTKQVFDAIGDNDRKFTSVEYTITIEADDTSTVTYMPTLTAVTVDEGDSQTFTVDVPEKTGRIAVTAWYVNNVYVATADSYDFETDFYDAGTYTVRARTLVGAEELSREWTVTVADALPDAMTFDAVSPATDSVSLGPDTSQKFEIALANPLNLDYSIAWFLNGESVKENALSYTFVTTGKTTGDYLVEAVVTDEHNQTVSIEWDVLLRLTPYTSNGLTGTIFSKTGSELRSAREVTVERANVAKIDFGGQVLDLSKVLDVDDAFTITSNLIAVDTDKYPQLNKAATVTIYGLSYTETPTKIFRAADATNDASAVTERCFDCQIIDATPGPTTDGTVVFTVPGFSTFVVDTDQDNTGSGDNTGGNTGGNDDGTDTGTDDDDDDSMLRITDVEVNGDNVNIDSNNDNIDDIQPDTRVSFEVQVENMFSRNEGEEIEDIEIEIVIEDIDDNDDIDLDSNDFDLDQNDDEEIDLDFIVPLEVEDGEEYDVTITVQGEGADTGDTYRDIVTFTIEIEKENHLIKITEARLSPQSLACQRTAELNVEVTNLGEDDERDVRLRVRNGALGIDQDRVFDMDEDPDSEDFDQSETFLLNIPASTPAGSYPITIDTFYSRTIPSESQTVDLVIRGCDDQYTSTLSGSSGSRTLPPSSLDVKVIPAAVPSTGSQGTKVTTVKSNTTLIAILGLLIFIAIIVIVFLMVALFKGSSSPSRGRYNDDTRARRYEF